MIYSYAQALEDVLLYRALGDIDNGFYIDVGAYHPSADSVTKLFYDKGWNGINIEASPDLFPLFTTERPRDVNLNIAASNIPGEVEFFQIGDTGLSTMVRETADRHIADGFVCRSVKVVARTLASVCDEYARRNIDFLKIDVEGAEDIVLQGADFTRFRPSVVVIESTAPLTLVENHERWEVLLTSQGYHFAVFDGLNRFYVAEERNDLRQILSFPADDYERATAFWTRGHLENRVRELEDKRVPAAQYMARDLAEVIGFKGDDENHLYRALVGGTHPMTSPPARIPFTSTLCQQVHFTLDQYRFWCEALKEQPKFLRKQWEFVYIAQAFFERGLLKAGKRGLAFGVGREPLPALFASFGAEIVASDQNIEGAIRAGWVKSSEHSVDLTALNYRHICTPHMFDQLTTFMEVDMTAIPLEISGMFDFCWSACSLEHLGSLNAGLEFIINSINVLKPGGVAIHTTEFNLSSDDATIDDRDLSIYRRRDIVSLIDRLSALGHEVEPIDWTMGEGAAEMVVDLPPYGRGEPHVRLQLHGYDCTSIGLIITKSSA